jgi:N-carbamoyl-L-amino-acid hydrolase
MSAPSTNLRIDGTRLWASLMALAAPEFGGRPDGGMERVALSAWDGACRDRFRAWCQEAGLAVRVDPIGNVFARREGTDPTRPPVLIGSHLDTQPAGGRFDGVLGVLAGLEALRTLHEAGIRTRAPIELVDWTDEEGSRFGRGLIGSSVRAGTMTLDAACQLADRDGVTVGEALDRIGYRGQAEPGPLPDAYFELHIEQGPLLEDAGQLIGIVTGAQAQIWFDVTVTGQEAHAGTTPPAARRDALVGAARIVDLVDRMMRARGEDGRGTVGQLQVLPNSRNTIPGEVRFSVEFRHPADAEIERLAVQFPREAGFVARDSAVDVQVTPIFRLAAQTFDPACIALVRAAASRIGVKAREMISGAGHDAISMARAGVPTAMIFTPCRGGLSHNPAESITPDEAQAGCQVLLEAVLARAGRAD